MGIIAADFAIIFFYQFLFMNIVNIIVTFIYLFSLLLTLYLLRDDFNIVNKQVYKLTGSVIYTLLATVTMLFLNMGYILIFQAIMNIRTLIDMLMKSKNIITCIK
jgi:hypothetical protein